VTSLGTSDFGDSPPDTRTKLVIASGPPEARLRITQALAPYPDLATRSDHSYPELTPRGSDACQWVVYCESVSAEQLERFKQLKHDLRGIRIVAVCEAADRRAVRRLIDAGIDGVVFADELEEALAPTVAAVFVGQMVVPREMRQLIDKPSLSTRERQILAMVMIGLTNQEIGARMFLAESTVKSHLSSAYTKLGVRSRSEAVAVITDRGHSLGLGIAAVAPKPELRAA
jgi:DNA-binding NarL/FixJ family response regulator